MNKVNSFYYKDFYCHFNEKKSQIYINDRPYTRQLDIFIEKDNNLIRVNTLILQKNLSLEKIKATVDMCMCSEIGKINPDGSIEKGKTDQGYVYKNYENFYKRKGKCYVAEGEEENNIEEVGISYGGIYEEVCGYLQECGVDITKVPNEQIEEMVEEIFLTVDWQHTSTLIFGDEYFKNEVAEFPVEYFFKGKNEEREL